MHTVQRPVDWRLVVNYAYSTIMIVPFSHDFVAPKTSLWRGVCMFATLISTCPATKTHNHRLGWETYQSLVVSHRMKTLWKFTKIWCLPPSPHHWCWVGIKVGFCFRCLSFVERILLWFRCRSCVETMILRVAFGWFCRNLCQLLFSASLFAWWFKCDPF